MKHLSVCKHISNQARDDATKCRMKHIKKTMKGNGAKDKYSEVFKLLNTTLIEANNK